MMTACDQSWLQNTVLENVLAYKFEHFLTLCEVAVQYYRRLKKNDKCSKMQRENFKHSVRLFFVTQRLISVQLGKRESVLRWANGAEHHGQGGTHC